MEVYSLSKACQLLSKRLLPSRQFRRASYSSLSKTREYFVIVRNKPNVDIQQSALLQGLPDDSRFTFAGSMFDASPGQDNCRKIIGTCLACASENENEVLKSIREHPYNRKGVWDVDTVEVWPLEIVLTSELQKKPGDTI